VRSQCHCYRPPRRASCGIGGIVGSVVGPVVGPVVVSVPRLSIDLMPARTSLSAERLNEIDAVVRARVGYRFSSSVRHHWKSSTFTTWDEAVTELRNGIIATVNCRGHGRRGRSAHRLRFTPDGSIELLNHPGAINEPAERMLAALGASMPECIAVALCFPRRVRVDDAGLTVGARQPLDGRLRMLWAAVSWAQDPDTVWDQSLVDDVLRYGVSLPEARAWAAAGWDLRDARRFWKQWAAFSVAEQWRAAGQTGNAAAVAAGLGNGPDDDARWLAAGFTAAKAARWRKTSTLSPEEAFMWESLGCPPTDVARMKYLPRSTPGLDMDTVLEWCRAGVPAQSTTVRNWWVATGGDLALSAKWAPSGTAPAHAAIYEQWNLKNPENILTPALVGAYIRAGLPPTCHVLAKAHTRGITPARIRSVVRDVRLLPDALVREVWHNSRNTFSQRPGGWSESDARAAIPRWISSDTYNAATRLVALLAVENQRAGRRLVTA
jgi:hypothetical protein